MNKLLLFIWSNREIWFFFFNFFKIWIPNNTSLNIVIKEKVKTNQQANEFLTFQPDRTLLS